MTDDQAHARRANDELEVWWDAKYEVRVQRCHVLQKVNGLQMLHVQTRVIYWESNGSGA
jgi:hypothetical protein